MWKLLFLGRRVWKLIPKEHRRNVRRAVVQNARTHGPTVTRAVRQGVRQGVRGARKAR